MKIADYGKAITSYIESPTTAQKLQAKEKAQTLGRILLAEGSEDIVEPSKSMQVDTTTKPLPLFTLDDFKFKANTYVGALYNGALPAADIKAALNKFTQKGIDDGTFTADDAIKVVQDLKFQFQDRAQKQRLRDVIIEGTGTVEREERAVGGGAFVGEDLGSREGFADIREVKNVEKTNLPGAQLGDFYFEYRNPNYEGVGSGTPPRLKEGPFKTKEAAQKAYNLRQEKVKILRGKGRSKKVSAQTIAINNFVKNFYNENVNKYGIRDYKKFEKALLEAYKKTDIPDLGGARGKLLRNLPNIGTKDYSNDPLILYGQEARNPSGKKAAEDFKNFFKKAFFAAQFENNPELVQNLKRYLDYYNIDKKFYKGVGFSRLDLKKQYADVLDPKIQSDLLYLLESDDLGNGKLRANIIKQVLPKEHAAYIRKKDSSGLQYKELMNKIEKSLTKEQLKKALDGETSIKKFMSKQTNLLNEIFNTSELTKAGYPELIFNADHLEGIAEIARMKDPNDKIRALKNIIGTTNSKNYALGMHGFSTKRKKIITDIQNQIDVKKNLEDLNKITKEAYPQFKGDLYKYDASTKSVKPTKNFIVEYKPEIAFKQYFEELFNNSVGRKELLKQAKNNPELAKIVSQLKSNKAGMYSFPAQLEQISLPPSVVKALSSVGKIVKGAGVVSGFAEPVFAAYNFSDAIDKGASLGQSGEYVVNKFVEDVVNIPGVVYGGGKYLKDKFSGKDAKFELPYEATFARKKLKETIDQTDPEIIKARLAERDFDTQVLPNLTMVDDIDMPASKKEIDKAKDVFMKEKDVDLSVLDKPKKSPFGKYNEQIKKLVF